MTISQFYSYLQRTRRDLWLLLEGLPDEVLSKNMIPAERFRCIKDLLMHMANVEDGWIHLDIVQDTPVWESALPIELQQDGAFFADTPLSTILSYWKAVEASTLVFLESLPNLDLQRIVEEDRTVEGLLWHVMQHEVRHTAQVALLIRQQGFKPPALDLLWCLPLGNQDLTT
jgi:uncharacterized damage-inducible protein DinB